MPPGRNGRVLSGIIAAGLWLAGILAAGAVGIADPSAPEQGINSEGRRSASAYELTAQLPAGFRKGESASLILHVRKDGHPAGDVFACLASVAVFASDEDAADTTPAMGTDLGVATEPASAPAAEPACVMALAAVMGRVHWRYR